MEGNKNTYSRSEWSSMSIQDRIRAMNQTLDEEDVDEGAREEEFLAPPAKQRVSLTPVKQAKDSMTSEETAELTDDDVTPKRASVVDMWRKRESMTKGSSKESPVVSANQRKPGATVSTSTGLTPMAREAVEVTPSTCEDKETEYNFEEKKDQNSYADDDVSWKNRRQDKSMSATKIATPISSGPVDLTYLSASKNPSPVSTGPVDLTLLGASKNPSPAQRSPVDLTYLGAREEPLLDPQTFSDEDPKSDLPSESPSSRLDPVSSGPVDQPYHATREDSFKEAQRSYDGETTDRVDEQFSQDRVEISTIPAEESNLELYRPDKARVWSKREINPTIPISKLETPGGTYPKQLDETSPGKRSHVADIWTKRNSASGRIESQDNLQTNTVANQTQRGSVLARWNKRGQEASYANETTAVSRLSSSGSANHESSNQGGATSLTGVKPRWAKRDIEAEPGRDERHNNTNMIGSTSQRGSVADRWPKRHEEMESTYPRVSDNYVGPTPKDGRLGLLTSKVEAINVDENPSSSQQTGPHQSTPFSVTDRWTKRKSDTKSDSSSNTYITSSPQTVSNQGSDGRRDLSGRKPSRGWTNRMPGDTIDSLDVPLDEYEAENLTDSPEADTEVTPPRSSVDKSWHDGSGTSLKTVDASPGNRKSREFVKMGQKHTSRVKYGTDSEKRAGDMTVDSSNAVAGDVSSGPIESEREAASLSPPLAVVHQKRKKGKNVGNDQSEPAATQSSPASNRGAAENVGTNSSKGAASNFRSRKFSDKKQLLLAKHRHRMKANRSPEHVQDEQSVGSEALSQVFLDAVPDDEQKRLSQQLTSAPQIDGLNVRPSLPVQNLLACGSTENDLFPQTFFEDKANPVSPSSQSEYASLCVSDSDSLHVSDVSKSKSNSLLLSKAQSPQESDAASDQCQSEAVSSFFSGEGSAFSGFSSSSTPTGKAGASLLASRAGRMLRGKRQRKAGMKKEEKLATDLARRVLRGPTYDGPKVAPGPRPKPTQPVAVSPRRSEPLATDGKQAPRSANMTESTTRSEDAYGKKSSTVSPSSVAGRNFSFSSDTTGVSSFMPSTIASEAESLLGQNEAGSRRTKTGSGNQTKDMIAEKFVSESNSNVEAFTNAYQSVGLEQIANDMREEVAESMLKVQNLDFQKLATDINEGMSAASESLNKFVGSDMFPKGKLKVPTRRLASPIEEGVAIEVEYIEDSDDDSYRSRGSSSNLSIRSGRS